MGVAHPPYKWMADGGAPRPWSCAAPHRRNECQRRDAHSPLPLARRDRRAVWRPPAPLKEAGWSGRWPCAARQEAKN